MNPPRSGSPVIATVTATATRLGLEIVKGVADFARAEGWRVLRVDNRNPSEASVFRRAGVRGLIVQAFDDSPVESLLALELPTVDVSNSRLDFSLARVASDDYAVGTMAADYFLRKGFAHFSFCGDPHSGTSALRGLGFQDRLKPRGHSVAVRLGNYNLPVAYLKDTTVSELATWLATLRKPNAILAWNDSVCDSIINICGQENWEVPKEISVLGVNNDFNRLADDERVAISSIHLAGHRIGYNAARLLARLLAGQPPRKQPQLIPPLRIVERRSTDHYAVADPVVLSAIRFIKRNYQQAGVEEIARAAKVSRRVLEKRLRRSLQSSPHAEVIRCRLERAKELLLGTDFKLEEIALLCGYDSAANFSSFFKEKAGCNPSAYRLAAGLR